MFLIRRIQNQTEKESKSNMLSSVFLILIPFLFDVQTI